MVGDLMVPAADILEVCEDYLQEAIDEKGLQSIKAQNLKLIHGIMNVIEDAAEEYNPLKSNCKKPCDF